MTVATFYTSLRGNNPNSLSLENSITTAARPTASAGRAILMSETQNNITTTHFRHSTQGLPRVSLRATPAYRRQARNDGRERIARLRNDGIDFALQ